MIVFLYVGGLVYWNECECVRVCGGRNQEKIDTIVPKTQFEKRDLQYICESKKKKRKLATHGLLLHIVSSYVCQ